MQLPIDEGEEWIWDTLDSTKECGFEYIKDGNKEFLIFNTNDFFADAKALEKIRSLRVFASLIKSLKPNLFRLSVFSECNASVISSTRSTSVL